MNLNLPGFGLGWLVALVVLLACLVIWIAGGDLTRDGILALIAGLALARLLP